MQLRALRFGFLQDGDVGVGVFPQREEVVVRGAGFRSVALHGVSAGEAEMRERSNGFVDHNTSMVQDFLKLSRSFATLMCGQICFPTHKDWIHCGPTVNTVSGLHP